MRTGIIFFACVFLLLGTPDIVRSQEPIWYQKVMQVKPGQTTKEEVEKIFQPSGADLKTFESFEQGYYTTKWGRISISFQRGDCATPSVRRDFQSGTVLYFSFDPEKKKDYIKKSRLKVDLSKFRSYTEADTGNQIYENHDLGIRYGFDYKSRLKSITLTLTRTQTEKHACKK